MRDWTLQYSLLWAAFNPPTPEVVCFGYLYNWYAVDDARELTSNADWTVPSNAQLIALDSYIANNGDGLKETGTLYWVPPNTGTNIYGLSIRGSGGRNYGSGIFSDILEDAQFWTSTEQTSTRAREYSVAANSSEFFAGSYSEYKKEGYAVRLVKDAIGIPDGTTTTYTGNDGKVYNAVAINQLYWTTENLEETQYRNGDYIPNVTDNTTWTNLTTGAWCVYENNANYKCK